EIRRDQSKPKKGEPIPIRCSGLVKGQQQVENEHRQSKPHQKQHLQLLIDTTPASNDPPDQCEKEKRRINEKMLEEKPENLERMKTEPMLEIPTRAQMRQRDPGMLRVPHNRRNRAKNEHPDQQIDAGAFEFPSQPWNERQYD